jgi:DNA-binding YbaB/EbfC family protein
VRSHLLRAPAASSLVLPEFLTCAQVGYGFRMVLLLVAVAARGAVHYDFWPPLAGRSAQDEAMTDQPKGPPAFLEAMRQASELKERIEQLERSLAGERVTAEVGAGMVKVVVSGRRELLSLEIEPELFVSRDVAMVQDLVVSAVNAGLSRAERLAKERMEASLGPIAGGGFPFRLG